MWVVMGAAAMSLGALVFVLDPRTARESLSLRLRWLWIGGAVGALMTIATYGLYPLSLRVAPFVASNTVVLYSAFRAPSKTLATVLLIPIIVGEELVWRGLVQTELVRRFGALTGTIVAVGIYALAHAPIGSPVLVVVAFGCGAVWSTLRVTTGSLVPPLIAHAIWDSLVLLWIPIG